MTYHIVRMGETIDKIVAIYQVDLDEIKSINKYVRNWEHLIPGTKLRLPEIPESLNVELDNDEPFIEEYYPKIDINNYEHFSKNSQNITQELKEEVNKKENEENQETKEQKVIKQEMVIPEEELTPPFYNNYNYYPPYYYNFNPYRMINRHKKSARR